MLDDDAPHPPQAEPSFVVAGGLVLLDPFAPEPFARRDVHVRGGRIASVTPPGVEREPDVRIIAAHGHIVLPGLVNAHTHSPDNLIRGTAPELPLELWSLSSAAGREGRTPQEIKVATLLGAVEMLRTGTTTVLDHVRLSPDLSAEGLAAVVAGYRQAGIRAVIAPVVADKYLADTLPFTPAERAALPRGFGAAPGLTAREQIGLVESFLASLRGGGRISGAVGPSGPQRCTADLLVAAGDLAHRRGVPLHTHALETVLQRAIGHTLHPAGMVSYLDQLGLLTPRLNLVHAIWLAPGDVDRVAERGATVVHNPVSNAKLGSGICALPDLLAAGVRVGLGTDSACCNDGNNLFETMKWTAFLHALTEEEPARWVGPARALHLATAGSADILGQGAEIGRIAPGYAADLVLLRRESPAFAPLLDPLRQVVTCETGASVDMVFVEGEMVVREGRCTRLDEVALWREAQELAEQRLARNAGVYAAAGELADAIRTLYARHPRTEARP